MYKHQSNLHKLGFSLKTLVKAWRVLDNFFKKTLLWSHHCYDHKSPNKNYSSKSKKCTKNTIPLKFKNMMLIFWKYSVGLQVRKKFKEAPRKGN